MPEEENISEIWAMLKEDEYLLGYGLKTYYPYELSFDAWKLIEWGDDAALFLEEQLDKETEVKNKELILFILAHIDIATVDDILMESLNNPILRPRALYLLGVINSKGYPHRTRDTTKLLEAITPYLDDKTLYTDILYDDVTIPVQDLAIGSFIAITGIEKFDIDTEKYIWIGLKIPQFSDNERTELLAAIKRSGLP